jgi:hypothetical protein
MDHQIRREMLIAALVAWGMVLIALTVCVGLLAAAGAVSLTTVGTAALGTATVAGTTVAIRRRRRR